MHKSTRGKLEDAGKRFVFGFGDESRRFKEFKKYKVDAGMPKWIVEEGNRGAPESVGQNPLNFRTLEINNIT